MSVVLFAGRLAAQSPQDWPTFKGGNSRNGRLADPSVAHPGKTNSQWGATAESSVNAVTATVDNTDTNPVSNADNGLGGGQAATGPLPLNTQGETTRTGTWDTPTLATLYDEAAEDAFNLPIRTQAITVGTTVYPVDTSFRRPPYYYKRAVAATSATNPLAGATHSFTWKFHPSGGAGVYAAYVYLPVQPTRVGGATRLYPQQYYVYTVRTSATNSQTFVLNTYNTGGGWVRIGKDTYGNDLVFNYNGTDDVQVTLYNTTPISTAGIPFLPSGVTSPNNVCVYADAARLVPMPSRASGSPVSARYGTTEDTTTVTTARNVSVNSIDEDGNTVTTLSKGVVTNYDYKSGEVRWRFSPSEESPKVTLTQDDSEANLTAGFVANTTLPHYAGTGTSIVPIIGTTASETATYKIPVTTKGSYDLYAYLPGNQTGFQFGRSVIYEIKTSVDTYTINVDQYNAKGWVRLGNRRFFHDPGSADTTQTPITVTVTNASSDASDATVRYTYTDAIRAVGETSISITSTPVYTKALVRKTRDTDPVETQVVVVQDEAGVIHCLDAQGVDYDSSRNVVDLPGTTVEYWSYPSTRDSKGYDPNLGSYSVSAGSINAGLDGSYASTVEPADRQPTAEMPTGFDLSSALVDRIRVSDTVQRDYLYFGSKNGRVYCIDMAGRGDFLSTDPDSSGARTIGTTTRVWTYPATYPSTNSVETSALGSFRGSVVMAPHDSTQLGDKAYLIVPTRQGRLYKLDALGNSTTKTTTVKDAFPALDQPTTGPILSTPSIDFGRVYFGTARKTVTTGEVPGELFALDLDDFTQDWFFRRTTLETTTTTGPTAAFVRRTSDFLCSPTTVPSSELTGGTPTDPNTLYIYNQNRVLYALNADTGAIQWATDELSTTVSGSMSYTRLTPTFGMRTGQQTPILWVPTESGRYVAMYARRGDVNSYAATVDATDANYGGLYYQGKVAKGFFTSASVTSSIAVSNNWMYAIDDLGNLSSFNDAATGTYGNGAASLLTEEITPDDPRGAIVRKTKVGLITASMYRALRRPDTDTSRATYAQALANWKANTKDVFEWGDTIYVLVYDFPYLTQNPNDTSDSPAQVDPPTINVSFVADGKTIRGVSVISRKFKDDDTTVPNFNDVNPTSITDSNNPKMNGYAILAFPLQNGGQNAVPPGSGEISVTMQTGALTTNGAVTTVALDPSQFNKDLAPKYSVTGAWSRYPFLVANPLAVEVTTSAGTFTNANSANLTNNAYTLGMTNSPGTLPAANALRAEALVNGNPAGSAKERIGTAPANDASHGQSVKALVRVVDRSNMALLRPGTAGLDNVRVDLTDLGWQGAAAAVIKPIDTSFAPNFEDLPRNYPNTSIDYPDISRDNVVVTKDPNGTAENPRFSGVSLKPPLSAVTGQRIDEDTLANQRRFQSTDFELTIEVPRYQPANNLANLRRTASGAIVANSAGISNPQGYMGRVQVFVDSSGDGALQTEQREAYRSLNLSSGVGIDERIILNTPTVNLGSLAAGAGLSPAELNGPTFDPTTDLASQVQRMHPWAGSRYAGIFKTFSVSNDGNVNLLNLRVAKISRFNGQVNTLSGTPTSNDGLSYLNGLVNVQSSLDMVFAPSLDANRTVFLQKPRVVDRVPTRLSTNPVRRTNANLGVTEDIAVGAGTIKNALNQTLDGSNLRFPPGDPKIGVTVPIGQPVGRYVVPISVFENANNNVLTTWARTPVQSLWDVRTATAVNGGFPAGAEAGNEPNIMVQFDVVESRLTNSFSENSPTLLDDLLTGNDTFAYYNTQPTAARDSLGALIVAWASNRGNASTTSSQSKIFLASLDNGGNFSQSQLTPAGTHPLRDLNLWNPASGSQWFRPYGTAYPNLTSAQVFGANILDSTVRYDSPAFPTSGFQNTLATTGSTAFANMKMAFVGRAVRQSATGQIDESRLVVSSVRAGANGALNVNNASILSFDPQVQKYEPSILQTGDDAAIVFYTGVVNGQSWGYATRMNGRTFTQPSALPFGNGFTSVSGVSATARFYRGAPQVETLSDSSTFVRLGSGDPIAEVSFTGQLRGRPYAEVYLGRAPLPARRVGETYSANPLRLTENADGLLDSANVFIPFPERTLEPLERESATVFRTRGVAWRRDAQLVLSNGSVSLLDDNSRHADRETGLITYESKLGGRVTFDPAAGTVRFTNAIPSGSVRLYLTYTPRFLRVSDAGNQGAAATHSAAVFDQRLIPDKVTIDRSTSPATVSHTSVANTWFNGNGQPLFNNTNATQPDIFNDRLVLSWSRSSSERSSARPFMGSMRLGVDLGQSLPSLADGSPFYSVGNSTVPSVVAVRYSAEDGGGVPSWYQVDAANGRIYFMQEAENRSVIVQYYVAGESSPRPPVTLRVGYVTERSQEAVPIETAANESNVWAFLDPFSYSADRRPAMLWYFWSSTRRGVSDIFFESVAPQWHAGPISK